MRKVLTTISDCIPVDPTLREDELDQLNYHTHIKPTYRLTIITTACKFTLYEAQAVCVKLQ